MKFAFVLSQENLDVSIAEVLALTGREDHELFDNLLVMDLPKSAKLFEIIFKRLAFTKSFHRVLFICKKNNLIKNMKNFPWSKIYRKDFSLSLHNSEELKEKDLAGYIYDRIKNPKVNLEDASTEIELFFIKNQVIATRKRKEFKEDYEPRKAQNRPAHHPSSMHPRWAKALINLTGIRQGRLLDPMCGSGGFLIEAGLMGLTPIGYDIDETMLDRAKTNLKYFKINPILKNKDATKTQQKFNYILTDLPYGKNTKKQDMIELYKDFFQNLERILKKRAVIVGPSFIDVKKIIEEQTELNIVQEFSQYIHHTLTRKIFVLEK